MTQSFTKKLFCILKVPVRVQCEINLIFLKEIFVFTGMTIVLHFLTKQQTNVFQYLRKVEIFFVPRQFLFFF